MPRRPFDSHTAHVACWFAETGAHLSVDTDQARRFLAALDPEAGFYSFRTFSETPYTRLAGFDPLERAIQGPPDLCLPELVELNRLGATITVTINASNGLGRTEADIDRVRALFVDDDRLSERPRDYPLPPHIRVQSSPGRFHAYWLVRGVPLGAFREIQLRLAERYRTDHKVCALNQSMAVPGLWRRKRLNRWFRTTLVAVEGFPAYEPGGIRRLFR
jgi:hypothetical protein